MLRHRRFWLLEVVVEHRKHFGFNHIFIWRAWVQQRWLLLIELWTRLQFVTLWVVCVLGWSWHRLLLIVSVSSVVISCSHNLLNTHCVELVGSYTLTIITRVRLSRTLTTRVILRFCGTSWGSGLLLGSWLRLHSDTLLGEVLLSWVERVVVLVIIVVLVVICIKMIIGKHGGSFEGDVRWLAKLIIQGLNLVPLSWLVSFSWLLSSFNLKSCLIPVFSLLLRRLLDWPTVRSTSWNSCRFHILIHKLI